MLVWVKNEVTNEWSKETIAPLSVQQIYKELKMTGTRYLALALVLKPKEGYRVEVYRVSETEFQEVDSFFVSSLSLVKEKLNELTSFTPKISKIKPLFGGESFVQNSFQKSETGSFLKPVFKASVKPKAVPCIQNPCIQNPCLQLYSKEMVEKQAKENAELRLKVKNLELSATEVHKKLQLEYGTKLEVIKTANDQLFQEFKEASKQRDQLRIDNSKLEEEKKTKEELLESINATMKSFPDPEVKVKVQEAKVKMNEIKKEGDTTSLKQIDSTLQNIAERIRQTLTTYKKQVLAIANIIGNPVDSTSTIGETLTVITKKITTDFKRPEELRKFCNDGNLFDQFVAYILDLGCVFSQLSNYGSGKVTIFEPLKTISGAKDFTAVSNKIRHQINTFIKNSPSIITDVLIKVLRRMINKKLYDVLDNTICKSIIPTPENTGTLSLNLTDFLQLMEAKDRSLFKRYLEKQKIFFTENKLVTILTTDVSDHIAYENLNSEPFTELLKEKWWSAEDLNNFTTWQLYGSRTNYLKEYRELFKAKKDLAIKQLQEFNNFQRKQSLNPNPSK